MSRREDDTWNSDWDIIDTVENLFEANPLLALNLLKRTTVLARIGPLLENSNISDRTRDQSRMRLQWLTYELMTAEAKAVASGKRLYPDSWPYYKRQRVARNEDEQASEPHAEPVREPVRKPRSRQISEQIREQVRELRSKQVEPRSEQLCELGSEQGSAAPSTG